MSKIHFESKSQLEEDFKEIKDYCKQLCQRYILKANHNASPVITLTDATVNNYVKDTF